MSVNALPDETSGPFLCEAIRHDGARVPFSWHRSMKEAVNQAARLCLVGCPAEARTADAAPDQTTARA